MNKSILKALPFTLLFTALIAAIASAAAPPGRYTVDEESATVRDERTGLIFSQNITSERVSYAEAEAHCASLEGNFRLPTRAELMSIVDRMTRNPAVDTVFRETTPADFFWTSTPDPRDPEGFVFRVEFTNGVTGVAGRDSAATAYARCVSGQ